MQIAELYADVLPDMKTFAPMLEKTLKKLTQKPIKIKVEADTKGFNTALAKATKVKPVQVKVQADTKAFKSTLAKDLKAKPVRIPVVIDSKGVAAEGVVSGEVFEKAFESAANPKVKVDTKKSFVRMGLDSAASFGAGFLNSASLGRLGGGTISKLGPGFAKAGARFGVAGGILIGGAIVAQVGKVLAAGMPLILGGALLAAPVIYMIVRQAKAIEEGTKSAKKVATLTKQINKLEATKPKSDAAKKNKQERLSALRKELSLEQGLVSKYKKQSEGLTTLKAKAVSFMDTISKPLQAPFARVLEHAGKTLQSLKKPVTEMMKALGPGLEGLGKGALDAFKAFILAIKPHIPSIVAGMKEWGKVLPGIAKSLGDMLGKFLADPERTVKSIRDVASAIVVIAKAVGGLAKFLVSASTQYDRFAAWIDKFEGGSGGAGFSGIGQGIVSGLNSADAAITTKLTQWRGKFVSWAKGAGSRAKTSFIENHRGLITQAQGVWQRTKNAVTTKANEMRASVGSRITSIKNSAATRWNEVQTKAREKWGQIKNAVTNQAGEMRTSVGTRITSLRNNAATRWNEVKAKASAKWSEIKTAVTTRAGEMRAGVGTRLTSLKNNAATRWTEMKARATARWTEIRTSVLARATQIKDGINSRITAAKNRLATIWNAVSSKAKSVWTSIKDAIGRAVDGIGRTIDRIKAKAAKPVNFVINTVYNRGIRGLLGKIPGVSVPGEASPIAYAKGGVMPGYTPGRDVHHFSSPTGGRLALSGGEAVMRPEFTKVVGRAGVDYINKTAAHGGVSGVRNAVGLNAGGVVQKFAQGGTFSPVSYPVSNRHGNYGHYAVDHAAPMGSTVRAYRDGVVAAVRHMTTSYGKHIRINHGGQQSLYAHLSRILVRPGQRVSGGQKIGEVGSTGNSTGPHLHFELMGGSYKGGPGGGGLPAFVAKVLSMFGDVKKWVSGMGGDAWSQFAKGAGNIAVDGLKNWLKDKIPGFAEGGVARRSGWAKVGEKGPELLYMNKGNAVVPNGDRSGRSAPRQLRPLIVQIDGETAYQGYIDEDREFQASLARRR